MATQGLTQTGGGPLDYLKKEWGRKDAGGANVGQASVLFNPLVGLRALGIGAAPVQNQYDPMANQFDAMGNPVTQMMQAKAMGQAGPSVAEMQQQQGIEQAQRAAMAAGAGSTNPAMARRMAIQQAGQLGGQAAMAGGQLRAQEQQTAQQNFAQMMQSQMGQQQQSQALAAQIAEDNAKRQTQSNGGLLSAVGTGIGAFFKSDKRLKHDIDTGKGKRGIDEFLKSLHAARYEYDNPEHGRGPQFGIMAQDAAKTEAGRTFVREMPDGLAIDSTRAVGPILAALARLDEKIGGR
jgi:hypothetical protein